MSSLILWASGFVLLIMILDRVPGVRHLVQPIVKGVAYVVGLFFGSAGGWGIYFIKSVWRAHAVFARHLTSRRTDIDPAERIRNR